jgi:hypothetical protein
MSAFAEIAESTLFMAWLVTSQLGTPSLLVRCSTVTTGPVAASDVVLAAFDGLVVGGVASLLLPGVADGMPSVVPPGLRLFATLSLALALAELLIVTRRATPRVAFPVSCLLATPALAYVLAFVVSSACNALDPTGFRIESPAFRFVYPVLLAVPQSFVGIFLARLRGPAAAPQIAARPGARQPRRVRSG